MELIEFLEDLGAHTYCIILRAGEASWECHATMGNQFEGRISEREAIEEFARSRCYKPREPQPTGWRGRLLKLAAMLGVSG